MNSAQQAALNGNELLALFAHFLSLSVFATGGAIALASDMHRYVVDEHAYINHTQFLNAIALAQAAPGPNVLFVTVMGWQIAGLPGALATTLGLSLPALVFPFLVSRMSRLAQFQRWLTALQRGLGPIAIGLMAATSWLLARDTPGAWQGAAFIVATLLLLSFTRAPTVLIIATAGLAGALLPW
jgi:chromate transporter